MMSKYAFLLFACLIVGCAAPYRPIAPESLDFRVNENTDDLDFSYMYDVLSYRGDKKYLKKEERLGYNIIAVRIRNKTNQTLNVARNLELYTKEVRSSLPRMIKPPEHYDKALPSICGMPYLAIAKKIAPAEFARQPRLSPLDWGYPWWRCSSQVPPTKK
jgi:hypothetical protein